MVAIATKCFMCLDIVRQLISYIETNEQYITCTYTCILYDRNQFFLRSKYYCCKHLNEYYIAFLKH